MGHGDTKRRRMVEGLWLSVIGALAAATALAALPVETTKQNFYIPGTQPGALTTALVPPTTCAYCHQTPHDVPGDDHDQWGPALRWASSMHGQAGRDPIFHAAFAIAQQDARFTGEACLRCHLPEAWASGKIKYSNNPQDPNYGKTLFNFSPTVADPPGNPNLNDMFGVTCSTCHRMVDPIYQPGTPGVPGSPAADEAIINALNNNALSPPVPTYPTVLLNPHNAGMVLDPSDRRRGPFDLNADWIALGYDGFPYHQYLQSPFHESSRLCATCHDVSLSHFSRAASPNPDGTYSYTLNGTNDPPAPDKLMQFPEQRTFSEWSQSLFASSPINLAGRFGGPENAYSSCQSCHMPDTTGKGCAIDPPLRDDLPLHNFNGANTWVQRAVRSRYTDDSTTLLSEQSVDDSIARSVQMLQAASDMELARFTSQLRVRIINYTGHKLPTGYGEGRRMWINVRFKDSSAHVIAERGAYDPATAVLNESDTKVYEMKIGPDATLAPVVGLTAGPSFHLVLGNKIYKDNRIPPIGFTNAAFEGVQAGHFPRNLYADGQYWDDTPFTIPPGARSAEVTVYHQLTSKEYIEFLRDANTDPNPLPAPSVDPNAGHLAYDLWEALGKSAPVAMDTSTIVLPCRCDINGNGISDIDDIFMYLNQWFAGSGDANGDGLSTVDDIFVFLNCWFSNCAGY